MPDQRIITLVPVTSSPVFQGQEIRLRQGDANPKNIVLYESVKVIPSPATANTIVLSPLPVVDVVKQYLYLYPGDATPKNVVLRGPTITITGPQTYTPTVGGTVTFSGTAGVSRTRVVLTVGGITFSGVATTALVPASSGTTYTPTVGGTITFSGQAGVARTRVPFISGQITFSGSGAVSRTRAYTPTGQVTFSGVAQVSRLISYIPAGGITFSGSATLARTVVPEIGGTAVFSGNATTRFIPIGGGGYPVRIYNGVSKAPMSGISVLPYVVVDMGGGNSEVTYTSGVSDNKTDSASYEGVEIL